VGTSRLRAQLGRVAKWCLGSIGALLILLTASVVAADQLNPTLMQKLVCGQQLPSWQWTSLIDSLVIGHSYGPYACGTQQWYVLPVARVTIVGTARDVGTNSKSLE